MQTSTTLTLLPSLQVDMPWTMLRTLGYNDDLDLELGEEYSSKVLGLGLEEDVRELRPPAVEKLGKIFYQFQKDGVLRPAQVGGLGGRNADVIYGLGGWDTKHDGGECAPLSSSTHSALLD